MPKKKQSADYDAVWKEDWRDITAYGPSYQTRYRLIRKLIKKYNLTRGDLLDAGCGDGSLLVKLHQDWPHLRVHGFDISGEVIQENKKKIDLTIGDLSRKNTLPGKKFDIIICSEVLEHIKEYRKAIANLSALLKKRGYLIITSPYRMKQWTPHDDYARHVRRWEDGQLEKELERNNITILESFSWGRMIYRMYYTAFLARQDPKKLSSEKYAFFKRKVFGPVLYRLFMLDDLFRSKGRTVIIVGKKREM
ncbi:MAG: class I SAM-dependent methyltransferase [Nanoarchaeota archaeon]